MAGAFGRRLRALRSERKILQSAFAERFNISSAYLSDIERGRRNPPTDKVILDWARWLDPGKGEEIGRELIELAARDQERAEAVTETEGEAAGTIWETLERRTRSAATLSDATPFLNHFGVDLVAAARDGRLDPAPGRTREYEDIACVLTRRQRNSVVLTCGSSAEITRVMNGLACAVAEGKAPEPLARTRLLRLDGIQAGVKYRGQFEERLKAVLDEMAAIGDGVLCFHSLADPVDFERNAKGLFFRPVLQAGMVRILTGATPDEMAYCRKTDAGLVACFRHVPIHGLDRAGVLRGLYEARDRYSTHHGVTYTDEVLDAIVDAAEPGDALAFWQRALDLLDEVGARQRLEGQTESSADDVERAVQAVLT